MHTQQLFIRILFSTVIVFLIIYYLLFYKSIDDDDRINGKNASIIINRKSFSFVHQSTLHQLNLYPDSIDDIDIDLILATTPIFVSGWSSHFRSRANNLCASVMQYSSPPYMINRRLIVYNLGLKESEMKSYKKTCPIVEFRSFNFTKYPKYVANLYEYRWKPLIIAEALIDFRAIIWMDSSVIFKNNNSMQPIYDVIRLSGKNRRLHFGQFERTGHSIFATTHPRMFDYFPQIDANQSKSVEMYGATSMLLYSTASTRANLLKWLVWCALEKECMAPKGAQCFCKFVGSDSFNKYANCHRFDQSAVSIIAAIANKFDMREYQFDNSSLGVYRA